MKVILGLKLGRRLTAAAALSDEIFTFHDVRSVPSHTDSLEAGITRYLHTLLEQLNPAQVYYYAPTSTQTTTGRLVLLVEQAAESHGVPARRLTKSDVFGGVSARPARTRRELRDLSRGEGGLVDARPPRSWESCGTSGRRCDWPLVLHRRQAPDRQAARRPHPRPHDVRRTVCRGRSGLFSQATVERRGPQ